MGNANEDFASVINEHGLENGSNTPDFLLARFLEMCLRAWDRATNDRDKWYLGHVMGSENYDAAQARVRELEAEVERLREDAALGADLRCLIESGLKWEWQTWLESGPHRDIEVRFPDSVLSGGRVGKEWKPFSNHHDAARAVREWQAGQENPLPDDACGKRLSEQVARFPDEPERIMTACDDCGVLMPSPGGVDDPRCPSCEARASAVDPEGAARSRIAAAGATLHEGHAVRVESADGHNMTISGVPTPAGLDELAVFAEDHRVAGGDPKRDAKPERVEPPSVAPYDPLEDDSDANLPVEVTIAARSLIEALGLPAGTITVKIGDPQ